MSCDFAKSYFDDVLTHSRVVNLETDVKFRIIHVPHTLTLVRRHKVYANIKKHISAASKETSFECIVGKHSVRPDQIRSR